MKMSCPECFIFKMASYKNMIYYEMELKMKDSLTIVKLYSGFRNGGDCTPGGMSDDLHISDDYILVLFIFHCIIIHIGALSIT